MTVILSVIGCAATSLYALVTNLIILAVYTAMAVMASATQHRRLAEKKLKHAVADAAYDGGGGGGRDAGAGSDNSAFSESAAANKKAA